jgi:hypothetical protein
VTVIIEVGRGVVGVWVILTAMDGVTVWAGGIVALVCWVDIMAAMVRYTWVKSGVAVLTGRLLLEIRVITCQIRKMTPAATATQTITVSRPKRRGVRFGVVIDIAH